MSAIKNAILAAEQYSDDAAIISADGAAIRAAFTNPNGTTIRIADKSANKFTVYATLRPTIATTLMQALCTTNQ